MQDFRGAGVPPVIFLISTWRKNAGLSGIGTCKTTAPQSNARNARYDYGKSGFCSGLNCISNVERSAAVPQ